MDHPESLPCLPANLNIVQVYASFLKYLMFCTKTFIRSIDPTATGEVWKTYLSDMVIVLPLPNGWEGAAQKQLREAAILANIIPNSPEAQEQVVFVSEAEASLHFCIREKFIGVCP